MVRFSLFSRFFMSAASESIKSSWDPNVSLRLGHPTLMILEKCGTREHFRQILAQMVRIHLIFQTFPMSRLLHFTAVSHPENLDIAVVLFDHFTPNPNLYIYNTMLRALTFSSSKCIGYYKSMLLACIFPDEHSLLALLKSSRSLSEGKQIHAHAVVTGLWANMYLQNSLIKMYSENGEMGLACEIFQRMHKQDIASCNIMIIGLARNGRSLEALKLFHSLAVLGFEPDQYTIMGLLLCCSQQRDPFQGKSIHAWMVRRTHMNNWDLVLYNALLDMYAKCAEMNTAMRVFERLEEKDTVSWNTMIARFADQGNLDFAHSLFKQMPNRDTVSWNSLLSGYAQNGNWNSAIKVFEDMVAYNVRLDKVSMLALICSASEMKLLYQGRSFHAWLFKNNVGLDDFLGSALIDMYCKCGSIEKAIVIFKSIPGRDVALWTAMISGLACHGHGVKALDLFQQMQEYGIIPNASTLIAVLTACSHAGLVDSGCTVFEAIKENYGIDPNVEHYGCLIDLLTRAGRLIEAKKVIEKMPMKPSRSIWGALLTACKNQGNLQLAKIASRELLKLEPEEESGYVLLSNLLAADGNWSHSGNIRMIMDSRGMKKMAGCSVVFIDAVAHSFTASDLNHTMWEMIYCTLSHLNVQMNSDTAHC
uniref:Pentatricopeptide repeat-containing protein At3g04750, mitochondrial n=1 Tax=Anthurium amnicola TaxID=1678845 RepID=A0A1D1XSA5_9ARAE